MEIGKPKILAKVLDSNNPQILLVADFSDWLFLKNKPATISITMPGSNKPQVYSFVKGSINKYNSKTLYSDCSECDESNLPDGIYKIRIDASPNTFFYEFHYLKADSLKLQLAKKIVDIGLVYTEEAKRKMEEIEKIKFYLYEAESNAMLGFISDAQKAFSEAQNLLDRCNNC